MGPIGRMTPWSRLQLRTCTAPVSGVSPWASSHPDGLEKVAEDKEFIYGLDLKHLDEMRKGR